MHIVQVKDVNIFTTQNEIEVALSVECIDNQLFGVVRRMEQHNYYNSKLVVHSLDPDFNITKSDVLCKGEDPRMFVYKNQLHCLSWTFNHNTNDLSIFIYNIATNQRTILDNQDLKFNGKNWVPYVYEDQLYFIYALEPLTILKFTEPNIVKLHYSELSLDKLLNLKFGSTEIGRIRAGTQGKFKNGLIHLFSRTGTPHPHIIHKTTLDPITFKMNTICLEPERKAGYHDPYGYFEYQGNQYISTTESDTHWHLGARWFKNSIYQVYEDKEENSSEVGNT